MPLFTTSELITHLTAAQNLDNARAAGDRFKLPTTLRSDLNADLADLLAKEQATAPAEGGRAGASAARRAALDQLRREHDGGYRFIKAIDEVTITAAQRIQVFECYGWVSGEIGDFTDARIIALARLAPTISATEAGNAAWLYPAARLTRIAAQLAIVDAMESQASGGDAQAATLARNAARDLAAMTLFRVRCFYCSATRDGDQTPELVKIGYQPRRDPGEAGGGGGEEPAPEPPAAPTGTSVTQENQGDAVVATADDDPAATLWEVFERPAGSADEFTLIASGTSLPVTFTHVPGEFEFVLRKTTPAGVSAFSAPVTLTVA